LLIIGVAYFCAGIFPPDPEWFVGSLLHGLGGLIVIFGSPMVFTLVSNGFIRNETSATIARLLICTAALTWLSLALFYGSIVAFGGAPRSGSIMVGWTNRILITTFVLWLLVAAFHVRGVFRSTQTLDGGRSPLTRHIVPGANAATCPQVAPAPGDAAGGDKPGGNGDLSYPTSGWTDKV
jgi:hypothetical protein